MTMHLEDTSLFISLQDKCDAGESSPLTGAELMSLVTGAARDMGHILDRTSANFPDYTLHDEEHAIRVVFLMGQLIGREQIGRLSVLDISLLILAAYAHDLGMGVGRADKEKICATEGYKEFLLANEDMWLKAEEALAANNVVLHEYISSQMFQNYLRDIHHEISGDLVQDRFAGALTVEEKSLVAPVATLARSHGWAVDKLQGIAFFPFAGRFHSDLQFLAIVLRLADYLALDPARAPESLMALLHPENEKSRREWRKHQANNFFVSNTTIEFTAMFRDFFEEKALRDTLRGIEQERRDCMDFLNLRHVESRYRLDLQNPLTTHISSEGYIYEEFRFRLDYKEIISILMGTRLYRDERVFLRELVQNALDACRCVEASTLGSAGRRYEGKVTVGRYRNDRGNEMIEVHDNGSGMTRPIITDYLMRIGRSYYQSFAFKRKGLGFQPVSQFGIGILSCFMVADYIEIETMPDSLVHTDAPRADLRALKLEIRGPHEYFVVRELTHREPGTTVRLFLKKPMTSGLSSLVSRFLGRIPYQVEIRDIDKTREVFTNQPFDFSAEMASAFFTAVPGSFGYASRDFTFNDKFGFGLHGRVRFYMLESGGRRYLRLHNVGQYSFVGFGATGETLLNPKQMTDEIAQTVQHTLNQVRHLRANFSGDVGDDIDTILRHFNNTLERLTHRHDPDELKIVWNALIAQVDAIKTSQSFRANVVSVRMDQLLGEAISQIDSFVTGQLRVSLPRGILTQDGIRLSSFFNLANYLKIGIGYLYNLDLCGHHRLTLNAARDGVVLDDKFETLANYFYSTFGSFLGQWFAEEEIPKPQLQEHIEGLPGALRHAIQRAYGAKEN
jgi:hypothetical protein